MLLFFALEHNSGFKTPQPCVPLTSPAQIRNIPPVLLPEIVEPTFTVFPTDRGNIRQMSVLALLQRSCY